MHHKFPVISAVCLQSVLHQFYFYFNIIYNTLVDSFPVPDSFLKNWRKLFFLDILLINIMCKNQMYGDVSGLYDFYTGYRTLCLLYLTPLNLNFPLHKIRIMPYWVNSKCLWNEIWCMYKVVTGICWVPRTNPGISRRVTLTQISRGRKMLKSRADSSPVYLYVFLTWNCLTSPHLKIWRHFVCSFPQHWI